MKQSVIITNPQIRSEVAINVTKLPTDGTYQVTIQPMVVNRTTQQNNLYWQWIGIISQHTGNSADMLHLYFKKKFLGVKYVDVLDGCVETICDSHTLSVGDFADYMTQVQVFAATELGIILPTA